MPLSLIGQFDWSEEHVVLGGVERKIKVAHFRLCYSRKTFVAAYPSESQEMVLDAFVRALAFYGGVPRRVIIDNPKTMVTYVSLSKDRIFHPRLSHAYEPLCDRASCLYPRQWMGEGAGREAGSICAPKAVLPQVAF